jgi:hypothetical protein
MDWYWYLINDVKAVEGNLKRISHIKANVNYIHTWEVAHRILLLQKMPAFLICVRE